MAQGHNSKLKKTAVWSVLVRVFGGEVIGFNFALFFVVAKDKLGAFANILFGFFTVACLLCLLADYCLKLGGKMKGNVTLHKEKDEKNFGLVVGLISAAPSWITFIVLLLSKAGVVGNFSGIYKFLNASFLPIIDLLSKASTPASDIPADVLVVFALMPLVMVATCHLCYKVSYNNIDVAKKVLYKKAD